MTRLTLSLLFAMAIFTSCDRSYRDVTLYQSSGGTKPIVAVLPVIDSTDADSQVNWCVAREMTEELRKRVYNSPKLYLLREGGGSLEMAERLNLPNPASLSNQSFEDLGAAEFVVVTELLDQTQKITNSRTNRESGAILTMAMRLRVIDIRGNEPKVILQEVLSQDHVISNAYLDADYSRTPWGTEAYDRTPLGMAHNKLARELVARVEGYVGANRS